MILNEISKLLYRNYLVSNIFALMKMNSDVACRILMLAVEFGYLKLGSCEYENYRK